MRSIPIPKPPNIPLSMSNMTIGNNRLNQICSHLTNKINSKFPILVGINHELVFLPKNDYQPYDDNSIVFRFKWTSDSGHNHQQNYIFHVLNLHQIGEDKFLDFIYSDVVFSKLNEWLGNEEHRIKF